MTDEKRRAFETGAIAVIRALGFVGNAHYCSECMNHFHADRGQHKPGCTIAAGILTDDDWWWVVGVWGRRASAARD